MEELAALERVTNELLASIQNLSSGQTNAEQMYKQMEVFDNAVDRLSIEMEQRQAVLDGAPQTPQPQEQDKRRKRQRDS